MKLQGRYDIKDEERLINEFAKLAHKKKVSKKTIELLIRKEIKDNNLEDVLKKIIWNEEVDDHEETFGVYDFHRNGIFLKSLLLKSSYEDILPILYHELKHAKQFQVASGGIEMDYDHEYDKGELEQIDKNISYLLSFKCLLDDEFYLKNHDLLPIEHEANFYGVYSAYKTLADYVDASYEDNVLFNSMVGSALLADYKYDKESKKIISPYEQLCSRKKLSNQFTEYLYDAKYISEYEKLQLGLPVERELYFSTLQDLLNDNDRDFDSYVKKL